ncbi:MAG: lytic transglycosylase domain-containing protein [Lautropia sp.]|nr:lytic transglycosylase domain-containing protein [Lautropia sp.]
MQSIESADPVRQSFLLTDLLAGMGLGRLSRSQWWLAVLAGSAWLMTTGVAEARMAEPAPVVQRTTPSGSKVVAAPRAAAAKPAASATAKKATSPVASTRAPGARKASAKADPSAGKRRVSARKASGKTVAANRASAGTKVARTASGAGKRAVASKSQKDRAAGASRLSNREITHAMARKVALADKGPIRLNRSQRGVVQHISRKYRVQPASVERYVSYAYQSGRAYKLDPYLILAVMATESSFNPRAESRVGAQGLMQVHTRVHKDRFKPYGSTKMVWQPRVNIQVGTSILADYIKRYGSERRALKAYVGAANLSHDFGYGRKVLKRRDEFLSVSIAARHGGPSQAAAAQAGRSKTADL